MDLSVVDSCQATTPEIDELFVDQKNDKGWIRRRGAIFRQRRPTMGKFLLA